MALSTQTVQRKESIKNQYGKMLSYTHNMRKSMCVEPPWRYNFLSIIWAKVQNYDVVLCGHKSRGSTTPTEVNLAIYTKMTNAFTL